MRRPEALPPAGSLATRRYGYDIFLSFALGPPPRGTKSYASDLARRLRERDFTVFFSEDVLAPGGELAPTLQAALSESRSLVLIANRETLRDPRWLRTEVETFRLCHPDRPIIPVNVDGALEEPVLGQEVQAWLQWQDKVWVNESAEALEAGIASAPTLERLILAPISAQSNRRWRRLTRSVIAGLSILALALGMTTMLAVDSDNRARLALKRAIALNLASEGLALLDDSRSGGDERALQQLISASRLDPTNSAVSASVQRALLRTQ